MGCNLNCLSEYFSYMVLEDNNPKRLFDRVNKYKAMGYEVDALWYNYRLLLWVRYYARLKVSKCCKCAPKIEFSVGPVSRV